MAVFDNIKFHSMSTFPVQLHVNEENNPSPHSAHEYKWSGKTLDIVTGATVNGISINISISWIITIVTYYNNSKLVNAKLLMHILA